MSVLTRRADFLAANRGLRIARPGFVLLARPNGLDAMRYGITVTKKIGNAVVRNRIRRLLKEIFRHVAPELLPVDVVIVARPEAAGYADRRLKDLESRVLPLVRRAIDRLSAKRTGP